MHPHVHVCIEWGRVEARVAGSGAQQRMVHRWQRRCEGSIVTAEGPQGKLHLVLLPAARLLLRALDHLEDTDVRTPVEVIEFIESFTRVDV